MTKPLTIEDIDKKIHHKIYTQSYSPKSTIEGVKIIQLQNHVTEDGDFCELIRITSQGECEIVPGFKIAQINRSKLFPEAIKAWHLHFKQDEIWYVPPSSHLIIGLWDLRKDSKTKDKTQKIPLGNGNSRLVFIPRGIAHGCTNHSGKPAEIFYFTSEKFDKDSPDEKRLNWDILGKDFWEKKRD